MILVDTSVWVEHFRSKQSELSPLLDKGQVATHPFIVGELLCGSLPKRVQTISHLNNLPATKMATFEEVYQFIERYHLMGKGVGFIDVHLLVSSLISTTPLWTRDNRLNQLATQFKTAYSS